MTRKEFRDFIVQKQQEMLDLFDKKNKEYGGDGSDVFHNFNDGYNLATSNSPEEFAWDLRCKHLQSIRDLITQKNRFTKEQTDEKFGDDILYGFIIWGIVQKYFPQDQAKVETLIGGYGVTNDAKPEGQEWDKTELEYPKTGLPPWPMDRVYGPPNDPRIYCANPKYRLTVDELIKRD